MRIVFKIFLAFFFLPMLLVAQNPTCPSPYVYLDGATNIRFYDPGLPLSSTNPGTTTIPALGMGLALMPNINGGTLCPTFYTTSNGYYHYWDGSQWVSTGHTTGHATAVNIAGCGSYIYNLVGTTGEIYVYDGQSNGSLLTTLAGFSSSGPLDLVADCDCNFYVIWTSTLSPGQSLTKYSPSGGVLATYSLVNMPHATSGTGFAITGNTVYLRNGVGTGFYSGIISGNSVNFSAVSGFNASLTDFATCPTCTTIVNYNPTAAGGQITCTTPTLNLAVTSSVTPTSYTWTGPGIVGVTTHSDVTVNSAGIYSCVVKYQACPPVVMTVTAAVTSNTSLVSAVIAPSGNICLPANSFAKLSVAHTSTNEVVSWSGPVVLSGNDTLAVNAPGTYTARVVNPGNGCEAQDIVHIIVSPTVQVALSSTSLCSDPYNGSPATITVTASGGTTYSLLAGPGLTTTAPNGTIMPVNVFNGNLSMTTGTVVGANGSCSNTATFSISIIKNPNVVVSSAAICPGLSHQFIAVGATSYTWSGSGLNTNNGATVTSTAAVTTVYTVTGFAGGCYSDDETVTLTILPLPVIGISPSFTTVCVGASAILTATGTASSYAWSGSSGLSVTTGMQVPVTPPVSQVYTVIGSLNGCTSIAHSTVNVVQPPQVSMSLDKNVICAANYNGSPNIITVVPSGASNYTLLSANGFTVAQPNGPVMQVIATGVQPNTPTTFYLNLLASSGVCNVVHTESFTIVPNPVIKISPPSVSLCPGQDELLSLSGASTYTWGASPSLTIISANTAIVKPSQTCFYSVMGSSDGCESDTKNAVVIVLPAPQVIVTPNSSTLCTGETVMLSAQGVADSYAWFPPVDIYPVVGASVLATPQTSRTYTVVASLNICTVSAVVQLSAIPMPKIYASADEPLICSSAKTLLKAGGATSYVWTPVPYLNTAFGSQVTASPPASITFTVWGFNGICSGSTSVYVETVPTPQIELTTIGGQNAICFGNSLQVSAAGASEYSWTPSAYVHAISSNSLVLLSPNTSTNFTVTGTNHQGSVYCYQQQTYSVTVMPKITPQTSGNVTLCLGEKTTLVAAGGTSYKWKPSEGLNYADANRVVASPTVPTNYTVEVSYQSYCSESATLLINVNPRPEVFAGRDSSFHVNEPINLMASGTGSVTWIGGEGIVCRSCAATQVLPSRSGCYIAEAVNEFGCTSTDEVCVEITSDFTFYLPNTFTPNNDGLNDVFKVYGENFSNLSMEIYDRWGQLLYKVQGEDCTWDGKFKGELCKPDTYVYYIQYNGVDRKKYTQTGQVTLVR